MFCNINSLVQKQFTSFNALSNHPLKRTTYQIWLAVKINLMVSSNVNDFPSANRTTAHWIGYHYSRRRNSHPLHLISTSAPDNGKGDCHKEGKCTILSQTAFTSGSYFALHCYMTKFYSNAILES
jgi:hypothetical protein